MSTYIGDIWRLAPGAARGCAGSVQAPVVARDPWPWLEPGRGREQERARESKREQERARESKRESKEGKFGCWMDKEKGEKR